MKKVQEKEEQVPGLRNEVIGQVVSQEVGDILRRYLNSNDKAVISSQTKVGFHTVDKLIQGANPLTIANCKALVAAVELAIRKTAKDAEEAQQAKIKMKSILKEQ